MHDSLLFFSTFLKYPKQIGSVVPSSKFLIDSLLEDIDFKNAKCVVEYGSGTGRVTKEILKRARKDAKIVCFEINRKFYKYLSNNVKDKRAVLINDSAENIKRHLRSLGIEKADYVVSGLPFSNFPDNKKCAIMGETRSTLKNNGKFVFYQFFVKFNRHLNHYFSKISTSFMPLNIPPCFVYVCEK